MKAIFKITNQRGSIPILKTLRIENNTMTATNLDMWITAPIDDAIGRLIGPGCYSPGVLTSGPDVIPMHAPLSDWPVLHPLRDADGLMLPYSVDDLLFVSDAQSTEQTRYYLNGVCFTDGAMVATDGHKLKLVSGYNVLQGRHILPSGAVDAILSLAKEQKVSDFSIQFFANGFQARVGVVDIAGKLVEGTFPPYQRVIPSLSPDRKMVDFDPAPFKAIKKEFPALNRAADTKASAVKLADGKAIYDNQGVRKAWPLTFPTPFSVGFNLAYLCTMPAGEMQFNDDSRGPVRIDSGNRLAVLMPIMVY